eukprot:gene8385-210_t
MKIAETQKFFTTKSGLIGLDIAKNSILISQKKYTSIIDVKTKEETKLSTKQPTLKTRYHSSLDMYSSVSNDTIQIWKSNGHDTISKKYSFSIINVGTFFRQFVLFHQNGFVLLDDKLNEKQSFEHKHLKFGVINEFEVSLLFQSSVQYYTLNESFELNLIQNVEFQQLLTFDENLKFIVDKKLNLNKFNEKIGLLTNKPNSLKTFKSLLGISFENNLTIWETEKMMFLNEVKFEHKILSFEFGENDIFVVLSNSDIIKIPYILENITSSFIIKSKKNNQNYLTKNFEIKKFILNDDNSLQEKQKEEDLNTKTMKALNNEDWDELKILLETKQISSKNVPIIETLIEKEQINLLMNCFLYVLDISESKLVILIHFIFNIEENKLKKQKGEGPIESFLKTMINYNFNDILMTKYFMSFSIQQTLCLFKFLKKCLFLDYSTKNTLLWIRMLIDSQLSNILDSKECLEQLILIQKIIKNKSDEFENIQMLKGNLNVFTNPITKKLPEIDEKFDYSIDFFNIPKQRNRNQNSKSKPSNTQPSSMKSKYQKQQ